MNAKKCTKMVIRASQQDFLPNNGVLHSELLQKYWGGLVVVL